MGCVYLALLPVLFLWAIVGLFANSYGYLPTNVYLVVLGILAAVEMALMATLAESREA